MDRILVTEAFVRTVELGSLSAAARSLGVGQSTVSKWVAALEEELGVTLIERTTRSQRVTREGQLFLEGARRWVDDWNSLTATVQERAPTLRGTLRVAIPAVFGRRHVVPHLGSFLEQHPDLMLDLCASDRYVSLVEEGFDVAIRVGASVPSTLRARRLAGTPRRVVASPGYLEARGIPEHPSRLSEHDLLQHGLVSNAVWSFANDDANVTLQVAGVHRADDSETLLALARAGRGVALLADWLVRESVERGELVVLLPDWSLPSAPIRAVIPPGRRTPPRVAAFLEWLTERWHASGELSGATSVS